MKNKILVGLMVIILTIGLSGCAPKKFTTGDEDLDAAIEEVQTTLKEDIRAEEKRKEEQDKKLASSKRNSASLNNDVIYIEDVYMFEDEASSYGNDDKELNVVVELEHKNMFPSDPQGWEYTRVSVTGINNGQEKVLRGRVTDKDNYFRKYSDLKNIFLIGNLNKSIEDLIYFTTDWDGYEEYKIELEYVEREFGGENVLDTATFNIKSKDIIKVSKEEYISRRFNNLLSQLKEDIVIEEDSDKVEVPMSLVDVEYLGGTLSSENFTIQVKVTNNGSVPISELNLYADIMTSSGEIVKEFANKVQQVVPGKSVTFEVKFRNSENKYISGDNYILKLTPQNNSYPVGSFLTKGEFKNNNNNTQSSSSNSNSNSNSNVGSNNTSGNVKEMPCRAFYYAGQEDKIYYVDTNMEVVDKAVVSALTKVINNAPNDKFFKLEQKVNVTTANLDSNTGTLTVNLHKDYYNLLNKFDAASEIGVLKSIAYTYGYYYKVDKVIIKVGGENYNGSHVTFKDGEYITVESSNIQELK